MVPSSQDEGDVGNQTYPYSLLEFQTSFMIFSENRKDNSNEMGYENDDYMEWCCLICCTGTEQCMSA